MDAPYGEGSGLIRSASNPSIDEWNVALQKKAKTPVQVRPESWKPPEQGWMLANVDCVVSTRGKTGGGGGVVLRDHDGAFQGVAAHFFPKSTKLKSIELMVCRMALQFASDLGVQKLHVELDCREKVCMLNTLSKNFLRRDQSWNISRV